jgi:hypothetical protein
MTGRQEAFWERKTIRGRLSEWMRRDSTSTAKSQQKTRSFTQEQMLSRLPRRFLSVSPTVPEIYSRPLRWLHAAQAVATFGAIGSVNAAMRAPKTPEGDANKANAMFAHKVSGFSS